MAAQSQRVAQPVTQQARCSEHIPEGRLRRSADRAGSSPLGRTEPRARRATCPTFKPGLEGVVAFETEIAEPDKEGGALRYRGVDIEDLIGQVSFGNVWALLVDGRFGPGLPPAEPFPVPVHSGDIRVDVQSAVAMLAPYWGSASCSTSPTSRPARTWPGSR